VPLALLVVDPAHAPPAYRHRLVLSRPDLHVAWRGDAMPDDPVALIDQIRGVTSSARPPGRMSTQAAEPRDLNAPAEI